MFIKRSAFLLLTAALAQQGCGGDDTDDAKKGGTAGTGGTDGAGAGAGGAPDNQAGSTMSAAGNGEAGSTGALGGAGGESLGGAGLGGEASGGVGGAMGGAGGDGGMTSCDDSVGTLADCSIICTDEFAKNWCDSVLVNLKPAVAEAYSDCIAQGTQCDDFKYECVSGALAGACPVADNDLYCSELVDLCDGGAYPIDAAGCHALIDGLSETGMTGFHSCIESDGCSFGLWSCVENLQ
jgi:hypothetical protein